MITHYSPYQYYYRQTLFLSTQQIIKYWHCADSASYILLLTPHDQVTDRVCTQVLTTHLWHPALHHVIQDSQQFLPCLSI